MKTAAPLAVLAATLSAVVSAGSLPSGKIHGVNLGSWLLLESWMLPAEWEAMGGERCSDCSKCITTEGAYAEAYGQSKTDAEFLKHWQTWFTQDDVNLFVKAGLNTVRIPLGYWLVEPLVNRKSEYFPNGGIKQLQRGLKQLKAAGISVILDHHGLPGAQDPQQEFTGRCTTDVQFYTPYNYHRALVWTAVMTAITHLDPAFSSVFAIEAVNEPIMDSSQTPGYGDFQKNFVQVIRAVELALGIPTPNAKVTIAASIDFAGALNIVAKSNVFNPEVVKVLLEALPMVAWAAKELNLVAELGTYMKPSRTPLYANFMDVNWQWGSPSNPADAAIGPQIYDNHLYYNYGGVADPNPEAYLTSICNLNRVENDAAVGNTPLYFGEWAITTNFNATDEFLYKWADAQKLAYSKGKGWVWWNFKTELLDAEGNDLARQWSYEEGLKRGYLTWDPAAVHDPHVCDPYLPGASSTSTSTTATATATSTTSTSSGVTSATSSDSDATSPTSTNSTGTTATITVSSAATITASTTSSTDTSSTSATAASTSSA